MLEPPSTRAAPSSSRSVSTFPIPFWKVIAQPSGASRRSAARAASRVALLSVKTMTRSAHPPSAGSRPSGDPAAGIRTRCSPKTPETRSPPLRIAST